MKYTQGYKNKKMRFSVGFYTVIALCIMLVGGGSYFAINKVAKTQPETNGISEYKDNGSSYIESVPSIPEISTPTTQSTESVPFESKETESQTATVNFTMPVNGKVLKDFSLERLQYSETYGDMRIHNGIDIECEKGTKVSACADGTVVSAEKNSDFGFTVVINHSSLTVKYSALTDVSLKQGDTVKMGDIIGKSDSVPCECADKPHIHLEVLKDGKNVSPLKALGIS